MEPTNQGEGAKLSQVIQIDEGKIQEHLGEVVRSTVEETLNALLDAEAKNARGGSVPGWQVRLDVGRGTIAPCGRHEVGHAALSGYEPTHGSERSGMNGGRKTFGSLEGSRALPGLCLNKCAKKSGHYQIWISSKSIDAMPEFTRLFDAGGIKLWSQ